MKSRVLFSKIKPPQPSRLLSRPRLITAVERCHDYRLLLITAGTGFGKTSLLTDYARSATMALAWYTLDENDRDPAVFCRYLLHSVRQQYPGFGQGFEEFLEQNQRELHQEFVLDRLVEEFVADLELLAYNQAQENFRETLLVLDDYQFAESTGVNRFVQRLIDLIPAPYHLVIATRSQPQNLKLTKLLAKQQIAIIGPADLVFSQEEINQLLKEQYNLDEPDLAKALANYSEGWITAVILALGSQSLTRTGFLNNSKYATSDFNPEQVFDYLAQEVLSSQSDELQNFLVRTSVLATLTPSSCAALLAPDEASVSPEQSESLLQYLESRNLFTTRLVSEDLTCYQYHALFRQFLLSKLKQNSKLYRETQLKAADAAKAAGSNSEAVQHYLEAGQLEQATLLLSEIVDELYEAGRISAIERLLEKIPDAEKNQRPLLLNIKARILMERGELQTALASFVQTEQLFRKEQLFDRTAFAVASQAQILVKLGRQSEAQALCSVVIRDYATLMQTPRGQKAIALTKFILGSSALDNSAYQEAEKNLREALDLFQAFNDAFNVAVIDYSFGRLYYSMGRLKRSNVSYDRALAYFIKTGNHSREAYCRISLANNSYYLGQYQVAEEQLNGALSLTQELNDDYLRVFVLYYLANIYRDTDRYAKADATYLLALQLAQQKQIRKIEIFIINNQAVNFLLMGKKEEVRGLLRLSLELTEEYQFPNCLPYYNQIQSWLELENRSFKRAQVEIEKAISQFEHNGDTIELTSSKLDLAIILFGLGEQRKALSALTESLELAIDLGFDPYLSFEFKWATPLFEYAARKKVSEPVEAFLKRHGFMAATNWQTSADNTLPDPIQFTSRQQTKVLERQALQSVETESALRVFALNGGRVWKDDLEIEQWRNNKSREALFYLLEKSKCTRDELIEALWPDEEHLENPAHALHNTLFLLRKSISPLLELKLSGGRYFLQGPVWYDAAEFSSQLKTLLANSSKNFNPDQLSSILSLYKRDFLDQFYSNWVLERQQELLQLYLRGLEKLAHYYESHNQPDLALPVWQQHLLKDPYNEETHQAIINSFLALGKRAEARRQADSCLKALEELDLKPSPETSQLLKKLA